MIYQGQIYHFTAKVFLESRKEIFCDLVRISWLKIFKLVLFHSNIVVMSVDVTMHSLRWKVMR